MNRILSGPQSTGEVLQFHGYCVLSCFFASISPYSMEKNGTLTNNHTNDSSGSKDLGGNHRKLGMLGIMNS